VDGAAFGEFKEEGFEIPASPDVRGSANAGNWCSARAFWSENGKPRRSIERARVGNEEWPDPGSARSRYPHFSSARISEVVGCHSSSVGCTVHDQSKYVREGRSEFWTGFRLGHTPVWCQLTQLAISGETTDLQEQLPLNPPRVGCRSRSSTDHRLRIFCEFAGTLTPTAVACGTSEYTQNPLHPSVSYHNLALWPFGTFLAGLTGQRAAVAVRMLMRYDLMALSSLQDLPHETKARSICNHFIMEARPCHFILLRSGIEHERGHWPVCERSSVAARVHFETIMTHTNQGLSAWPSNSLPTYLTPASGCLIFDGFSTIQPCSVIATALVPPSGNPEGRSAPQRPSVYLPMHLRALVTISMGTKCRK